VFVDALGKRQTSFGLLSVDFHGDKIPFSRTNFERLIGLEIFEKLKWAFSKKK
jgi:hypothetical protein